LHHSLKDDKKTLQGHHYKLECTPFASFYILIL
jgi:hypothetical protein